MKTASSRNYLIGGTLLVLLFNTVSVWANSKFLNVQGKLTDSSGAPLTGSQTVTFRLYTSSTSGSAIWTESQSVILSTGLFNVTLGSVTALDSLPFTQAYYLGIQVAGDSDELSPRQPLGASAYAQGSLGDFNVGNNFVAGGSVTANGSSWIGAQAVMGGSVTIKGDAFSVGGASFTVHGGSAVVAYSLTVAQIVAAGSAVVLGTMTVQGNAFSIGGSTFAVSAGTVQLGGLLKVSVQGLQWNDGSVSTTAAPAYGAVLNATQTFTGGNTFQGSATFNGGASGTVYRSTFVYLCNSSDQTPTPTTQATAATLINSTGTLSFSTGSWAEVIVTFFHLADGTQYYADLYIDNARPLWVGSNGILTCQGTASSVIGVCTAVFPIPISSAGTHTFYWKIWRGGNPVTIKMSNPCSYYTIKEMRGN